MADELRGVISWSQNREDLSDAFHNKPRAKAADTAAPAASDAKSVPAKPARKRMKQETAS